MEEITSEIDRWLRDLDARIAAGDWTGAAGLFAEESFWRDLVLLSWNIITVEGRDAILDMLGACVPAAGPVSIRLSGPATAREDWIEAEFTVRTRVASGRGHVRLKEGKGWTITTSAVALHDHPWAEGPARPLGPAQGARRGRVGPADGDTAERSTTPKGPDPHVLIIGGGQGGMALAARLNSLGVRNLVVEARARAGDSWRDRYESLCLHDPVWYDHMPYLPFPSTWPVFTPKERMADWLEMYAKVMALDYWPGTRAVSATRRDAHWEVTAQRDGRDEVLCPVELVFATGMSGYPHMPDIPGAAEFAGQQLHASAYRSGRDHAGAWAVVVGANTSAHDICQDLWEHGVPVTMIQRSSTLVARSRNVVTTLLGPLYSEEALRAGITTEQADFLATTWPWAVLTERAKPVAAEMAARDADLHERLRRVGFQLDTGWDGSGIPLKSARQGGGFYIDVGASDLIAEGEIGLVSGQEIARLEPDAMVMSDGTRLPCDLVIYATGYGSMTEFVREICGEDVAGRVGRVWGLGSATPKDPGPWEGELRNMWKPTGVDGLWFQGGNLAQSRHYSRFLALQIAARAADLAGPVYAPSRDGAPD